MYFEKARQIGRQAGRAEFANDILKVMPEVKNDPEKHIAKANRARFIEAADEFQQTARLIDRVVCTCVRKGTRMRFKLNFHTLLDRNL